MYVGRIKKTLERDAPLRADTDSLERGIAFDAEACMADDFGGFKPEGRVDLWRGEALVVRQLDGVSLDDKEPSVSAWGQDSGFLGGRFDFVIWDDLVDRKNTKTQEAKENLRVWYDSEAETRLEPRGLFLLQGQRIQHDDLYRYCLDKKKLDETPKYRHIVYQAHDEEHCAGDHDLDAKPWPDGCLLDPWRLPWKDLETLKHNNPRNFEVMYQQKDGDIVGGLLDPAWIEEDLMLRVTQPQAAWTKTVDLVRYLPTFLVLLTCGALSPLTQARRNGGGSFTGSTTQNRRHDGS